MVSGIHAGACAAVRPFSGTSAVSLRTHYPICAFIASFLFIFLCSSDLPAATPAGTVISNTAAAAYTNGPSSGAIIKNSNTVTVTAVAFRTPSTIELLQYAPGAAGAQMVTLSPPAYSASGTAAGPFVTLPSTVPSVGGATINLANPVPLVAASQYHAGEPVFIRVTDPDQNLDPNTAETVLVTVTDNLTGDSELLRLTETGPNTGVFAGYLPTTSAPSVPHNGQLSVVSNSRVSATYTDVTDNTDASAAAALVDPLGKVFSSSSGQPVNGVSITIVDANTGQPAAVFGDNGVATFPSTVVSGGTIMDSGGTAYSFPAGTFRFPAVPPGTYRYVVTTPAGYRFPSTVPFVGLQGLPGGPFALTPASQGSAFTLTAGFTVHIDIPVDTSGNRLFLLKSAANSTAAIGDFLQYQLSVQNTDTTAIVPAVVVSDALPLGFRYRKGSTKLNGLVAPDPSISSDGRTLTFTAGDLAAGSTAAISYVTEIAAGAQTGTAVNTAVASGTGATSNTAAAQVLVTDDLFSGKAFIAGRLRVDGCGKPDAAEENGLEGVRLFLEDGTYVVTDKNGMYHFEGVTPGTHVVQVDLETIPEKYEILSCEENDRFAETAYSQFVDIQGGTLWRADFHLGLKPPRTGEAGIDLQSALTNGPAAGANVIEYSIPLHVGPVPLRNLRLTVMLPDGASYQPGSTGLNAVPQPDPGITENALTFRVGDMPADWDGTLRFRASIPVAGNATDLATKALLTFDTPQKKDERTPVVDNLLVRRVMTERRTTPDIVLHPRFAVLNSALNKKDQEAIDRLIESLKQVKVRHITVTGHTDSKKIAGHGLRQFKDNYELSRARAETVGRYIAAGLNLSPEQVTFIGKGPDEPVATNETAAGRALNRRVEIQVETESAITSAELKNEKDRSGMKTVPTTGLRPGEKWAEEPKHGEQEKKEMPEYTKAWLESAEPGLAWVWPGDGYHPSLPASSIAVKHDPELKLKLFLNGAEVDSFFLDTTLKRQDDKVALAIWRNVHLEEGDNILEASQYDENGAPTAQVKRVIHYSRPPVKAELAPAASKLVADGKTPPIIAVLLTDKDGHPAREGVIGEYAVDPPHIPLARSEDLQKNPLTASTSDKLKFQVGENGIALIQLQPTTQTGQAVIRFKLMNGVQEVRAWLEPEKRDWILVGLAEGTVGYNVVKGNMESLAASGVDDQYYKDGRVAFYAKGAIKGEWLLTIAYDSNKSPNGYPGSLYQTIDPNTYYTLYGDATNQHYDAASSRALYLKLERKQFYALFGDYDTGLTMTELSRYTRQFTGLKSEMKSNSFDYTIYVSQNDQTFIKDEIQGNGTSGLYQLSQKNIMINSETVVIETRDRFRSELIVSSQPLTRSLDYTIDYNAGTIWFKAPVFSRDANFNPNFIVVRYEVLGSDGNSYNYGGRGAVRVYDNKVEVGATYIHEEQNGGTGNLAGADATVKLDDHTKLKAEVATTKNDESGSPTEGTAYLAELSSRTDKFEGKAYVRDQPPGFGLGQQNVSETGTRKTGFDLAYRLGQSFSLQSEVYHEINLATEAVRDVAELESRYSEKRYEVFGGVRYAEDTFVNSPTQLSDQIFVGSRYQMTDRLSFTVRRDQSIGGENGNADFPTRTILGADYKLNSSATLFANQELTHGASQDTATSRVGLRSSPWAGGQINSTIEDQSSENGERLFSTLGLKQTWQVNKQWSVDVGLDRSATISGATGTTPPPPQFNSNVPPASGGPNFTAVSLGAGYRAEKWSWTGRVEERFASGDKNLVVLSGVNGEVREGLGLAAGVRVFQMPNTNGARTSNDDLRLSLAYRPKNSDWIVLDRLDFIIDERRDSSFDYNTWRTVNNLNVNYKPAHDMQIALQYACKYVQETIDQLDYRGYTDLIGLEGRYDVTKTWDIGLRVKVLHSWSADQYKYGTGPFVGFNFAKNLLLQVGYNITGFSDRDFSKADFTACGPFLKLSLKFDQMSIREAVKLFSGQ